MKTESPQVTSQPVFVMGSEKTGKNEERITSLEIAEMANKRHCDVMRSIRNMEKAWVKICGRNFAFTSQLVKMPNGGTREEPCYSLTKRESLYIATKFNDEARAKLVLRWEELETKNLEQEKPSPQQGFLQEKLVVADWMMKTLRYSEVAKLQLVSSIVQPYGLPVPEYVSAPNGAKHSASELLKTHNIDMSAIKFNKLAMAAGLLELRERKGHTKIHKFYSITDKGSAFGENDINMNNPNQTQPHWYDGKFAEVLELIKANLESQVNLFA